MVLWTPAQIATAAWWDASDVSTISDTGGAVDQWSDKSGNGRHFTQVTPTEKPTTGVATIGGLNALDFDNDDALLNSGLPSESLINFFLVRKVLDGSFLDFSGSSGSTFSYAARSNSPSTLIHKNFGAPTLYKSGVVITPVTRGDVHSAFSDDTPYLVGFIGADTSSWADSLTLGFPFSPSFDTLGQYGEILAISGALATETRQKIEGYLSHKWGLQNNLPTGHPYKSAAPIVSGQSGGTPTQNGLVASVDYPSQRIYLGIGSANTRLDTLDVFREVRTLRATTEDHRRFPPIIFSGGNLQKTADTATAKFVKLTSGAMIVPYDGDHTITLIRDTFTEDNISGTDIFDLTLLSPSTSVQIKEDIPQVEVITVSTGSGLDSSQDTSLSNIEIIASKLDSLTEDVSGYRFTQKALEEAVCNGSEGGSGPGPTAEEIAAAIINTIVPHP